MNIITVSVIEWIQVKETENGAWRDATQSEFERIRPTNHVQRTHELTVEITKSIVESNGTVTTISRKVNGLEPGAEGYDSNPIVDDIGIAIELPADVNSDVISITDSGLDISSDNPGSFEAAFEKKASTVIVPQ